MQRDVDRDNSRKVASADGVECDICGNKGVIYYAEDGYEFCRECECMKKRRSVAHLRLSGMERQVSEKTFDNFVVSEPWQKRAKEQAQSYADNPRGWFFCGGQVGCGKTHLCTAICGELLKKSLSVRYMLWRDESVKLKAAVNDSEYSSLLDPYKECDVLYIDDFFKTQEGQAVTKGDVNLAFELINWRYVQNKLTIFSSERFVMDILQIDEAVGSRIYEKTKGNGGRVAIKAETGRNYRLK